MEIFRTGLESMILRKKQAIPAKIMGALNLVTRGEEGARIDIISY